MKLEEYKYDREVKVFLNRVQYNFLVEEAEVTDSTLSVVLRNLLEKYRKEMENNVSIST